LRDKRPPERVRVPATRATSNRAVGKVAWQMGAVVFPAEKSFGSWEQPFFRRRSRFANVSSHFSGGKVTWQICKMTGLMSKTLKNTLK
jgi:hypothetical protein